MGRKMALALIRTYQKTLSRALPPRCRFHPSCSEYAAEAIEQNGVFRGGVQALVRLAKCGPWHPGGLDQVPVVAGREVSTRG